MLVKVVGFKVITKIILGKPERKETKKKIGFRIQN